MKQLIDAVASLAHDLESLQHYTARTPVCLIEQIPGRLDYVVQQLERLRAEARNLAEEARRVERGVG